MVVKTVVLTGTSLAWALTGSIQEIQHQQQAQHQTGKSNLLWIGEDGHIVRDCIKHAVRVLENNERRERQCKRKHQTDGKKVSKDSGTDESDSDRRLQQWHPLSQTRQ